MPPKRQSRGSTPRKSPTKSTSEGPEVSQPGRYTAPQPNCRLRPKWHRFAGWFGIFVGVAIAVANDGMLIVDDWRLLPFGHQELYLILALLVGGSSTWFLGLFDRGITIYD